MAFPVAINSPRATFEIQYGHVERPNPPQHHLGRRTLRSARTEVGGLVEGDYGVALLNDCKYGYDVLGNVLRLTLLRAPKSPDAQADMGEHRFTLQFAAAPG